MAKRRAFLKSIGVAGTAGVTGLAGCTGSDGGDGGDGGGDGSDGGSGDDGTTSTPEPLQFGGDGTVNFGISPSVPQDDLEVQYSPFLARLENYLPDNHTVPEGLTVQGTIGSNYSAIDVAETGPFAAALGVNTDNVEIILQRFGYGSWEYKSVIATRNDSDVEELSDLAGGSIAFSDRLSTSGALYPLRALSQAGLDVGNLPEGNGSQAEFEARFPGGHVSSYKLLEEGQVDAAGMGGFVRDTGAGPAPEDWQDVATTVHEDTGLPRAPIVVSTELSDEARAAVQQAYLDAPSEVYYGEDGEDGTDDDLWFGKVREASQEDYQSVIDVANELGVGPEIFQ
ncbi:phosphate/phosphite/phosphonate ABC transporter substrate-binding protein [Halobacteriales archaeon SW_12_71_31]|nr:MAG: phosphate/phosphite/phosphonate ABC transporter substrate-binding protein [Halobacteriales archaeon SW_12_71_31]